MSEPHKQDIAAIFKRLRSVPTNKACFDCGAKNPSWASITYGVFLCIDCSGTHRSLGVHLSFIRNDVLTERCHVCSVSGEPDVGPSVDLLSMSPKANLDDSMNLVSAGSAPTKDVSSLLKKKPGPAKKGFGAKKAGLGAQKVSSKSFSEIEKHAQAVDKIKEQEIANVSRKTEEPIVSSLRLAYKDLEIQQQKEEAKMKNLPAKKKAEAERLGMGFGNRSGISHSVLSEMQMIEQEAPRSAKPKKIYHDEDPDDFFFSSGGGGSSRSRYRADPPEPVTTSFLNWDDQSDDFWKKEMSNNDSDTTLSSKISSYDDRPATRRKPDLDPAPLMDDAQKKFGNAKSISSDMYFGKQDSADYETRARLERLSGNASISSADLFDDQKKQTSANYNLSNVLPSAPDMANFKQGVKSVAGRLSVLANGVMTTIQDRYGS
ncbi:ADP-ribosylation factor GTPase-activating protein 3 [Rhinoderma darwinii]|uniref:ADP-ribosylation factor GTPase-activating protein 3 n=1 Tax=Rhinoderma darwinii TaxID=43563 RepID=UPI003F66302A